MSGAEPGTVGGGELLPGSHNALVHGLDVTVNLEAVSSEDTVSGTPRQGTAELGTLAGADLGIWELRGGTVTDTEVDEFFVVLSGSAVIEFLDELGAAGNRTVEVGAGDVMRLTAGSRTRWIVEDHIRKVYIAPSE